MSTDARRSLTIAVHAPSLSQSSKMHCRFPNMVVADLIPNTQHVCVLRASANFLHSYINV